MKKIFFYTAIIAIGFTACQSTKNATSKSKLPSSSLNKEAAVLWQQTSAEYDALCYQAFNIAKHRIDLAIERGKDGSQLTIVMDLDETVLDNSPYNGFLIKNGKEFDKESWNRWVQKASAELVPGALDFIKYAEAKGATIYYISNRSIENINPTVLNLQKHGINVDQQYVLLSEAGKANKDGRRQYVNRINSFEPVLLIGDNLADFIGDFENDMSFIEREKITKNLERAFGNIFIMLPNTMYGGWEKALKYNDPLIQESDKGNAIKYLNSFE